MKLQGIKGLAGASALDRTVWNEFHADPNEAVPASEEALRTLFDVNEGSELAVLPKDGVRVRKCPPQGATEASATVELRRGQEYFRAAVLNNFGEHFEPTGRPSVFQAASGRTRVTVFVDLEFLWPCVATTLLNRLWLIT